MRTVFNILIGVMLTAILAGAVWHTHNEREHTQQIEKTRHELQRFDRVIALRSALQDVELSDRGYPMTIDPMWFESGLPRNALLDNARPWLEIADDADHELQNPPDLIATDRSHAAFWYNPHTGALRARVPEQTSNSAGITLYNLINGTSISAM